MINAPVIPWRGTFRAVVFDLFGTLVPAFSRAEHTAAMRDVAAILDTPFDDVHRLFSETYGRRTGGDFTSIAANLRWICGRLGHEPNEDRLWDAETRYAEFTRQSLAPLHGVVETLQRLTEPVGLLTNCAPDVPEELPRTALAEAFDAAVFSGRDGLRKPDPRAYLEIAERLRVGPEDVLYVGDGSDDELTGAASVGMHAVLVSTDLSDAYDQDRADVLGWSGPVIARITDLLRYRPE